MNNITPRAQQIIALALRQARKRGQDCVSVEFFLLAICELGQGVAFNVLTDHYRLDMNAIRDKIERTLTIGIEKTSDAKIPFALEVKKLLALAERAARDLNHSYLGTEHMLIGMVLLGEGDAFTVLKEFGVGEDTLYAHVMRELDPALTEDTPSGLLAKDDVGF